MKRVKRTNLLRYVLYSIGVIIMCGIVFLNFWAFPKINVSNGTIAYVSLATIWFFAVNSSNAIESIVKRIVMNILFDETEISLKKNNIDCELEITYNEENGVTVYRHDLNFATEETPDINDIIALIGEDIQPICDQVAKMFRVKAEYTVFVPDNTCQNES